MTPSRDTEMPDSPADDASSSARSPVWSLDSQEAMPLFSLARALADSPPLSSSSFIAAHTPLPVTRDSMTTSASTTLSPQSGDARLLNSDARLASDTTVEIILPTASLYSAVLSALATLSFPLDAIRFNPLPLPASGRQMLIDAYDPVWFHEIIDRLLPVVQANATLRAFVTTEDSAESAGLVRMLARRDPLLLSSSSSSSSDRPLPMKKRMTTLDRQPR